MLFDPQQGRITGIMDFTDVVITTPLLDFEYLYQAYGSRFLTALLGHYCDGDPRPVPARMRLLHRWYLALRLLWALDPGWEQGVGLRLGELRSVLV